jgi:hypothetical protein
MRRKKFKDEMTIAELARTTNTAFNKVEIRFQEMRHEMQAGFQEVRRDFRIDLREVERHILETEEHLLDAINGVEVRRPEFDALKGDVEDLSGRVGILEGK